MMHGKNSPFGEHVLAYDLRSRAFFSVLDNTLGKKGRMDACPE